MAKIFCIRFSSLLFLVFISGFLKAQDPKILKKDADTYYEKKIYQKALKNYLDYSLQKPGEPEILYRLAFCYYQILEIDRAERIVNDLLISSPDNDKYTLLMGQIKHYNEDYRDAIKFYKRYLKLNTKQEPLREAVKEEVKRAGLGLKLSSRPSNAFVENLGKEINSTKNELGPVLSPNFDNKLYFASNKIGSTGGPRNEFGLRDGKYGDYNTDMYFSVNYTGKWSVPEPLPELLNSASNDLILDFNEDGQVMYFFKGTTLFSGEIYVDTFSVEEGEALFPPKFNSPVIPESGDLDVFFFQDSIMLFSSHRLQGYGGADLYIARSKDGAWSTPENLGPIINSPFDERCPFLAPDGRSLYFSTNNSVFSVGGYDIVLASFDDWEGTWGKPENQGLPVNSPADELYFRLSKDATQAYFATDRKGTFGGFDLFTAIWKVTKDKQVAAREPILFTGVPPEGMKAHGGIAPGKPGAQTAVTFEWFPLHYDDDRLLPQDNKLKLFPVVEALKACPDCKVLLSAHSDGTQTERNLDVYFSVKRLEQVALYLVEQGVRDNQILLQGLGHAYPLAKEEVNNQPNPSGQKMNRRVELAMFNPSDQEIVINYNLPIVSSFMRDDKGAVYREMVHEGLSYRIHVMDADGLVSDLPTLFEQQDVTVEKWAGDSDYRYLSGLFKSYKRAASHMLKLRQSGLKARAIVPYINGVPINNEEVRQFLDEYPDLLKFFSK